jgi:hypothetical protein
MKLQWNNVELLGTTCTYFKISTSEQSFSLMTPHYQWVRNKCNPNSKPLHYKLRFVEKTVQNVNWGMHFNSFVKVCYYNFDRLLCRFLMLRIDCFLVQVHTTRSRLTLSNTIPYISSSFCGQRMNWHVEYLIKIDSNVLETLVTSKCKSQPNTAKPTGTGRLYRNSRTYFNAS